MAYVEKMVNMKRAKSWWMLPALCLSACADPSSGSGGTELPEIRAATAQLVRAEGCTDLLSEIQADAVARVDQVAEALRDPANRQGAGYDGIGSAFPATVGGVGSSVANPTMAAPRGPIDAPTGQPGFATGGDDSGENADPQAPVEAPLPDANAATEEVTGPKGYSETNRQVAEVDEADIVKVDEDGRALYVLHGDRLIVLRSWPAEESEVRSELKLSIGLGARPYEMFVKDGRVAVFSSVQDSQALRMAGGDRDDKILPATTPASCPGCGDDDRSFTKLTLIDASGDKPQIRRELFFDGTYLSSRRYDDRIRAVIRGGFKAPRLYEPAIEYYDPWGQAQPQAVVDEQIDAWRERTIASILDTTLDQWLPTSLERLGERLQPLQRDCASYYIPSPGMVSYGMTHVVEVALDDDEGPLSGAVVLGDAALVYSNTSALVVAQSDYRGRLDGMAQERTVLHRFELGEAGGVQYGASGYVSGHLLNQFSMDVQQDLLRVTTVEQRWDEESGESVTDNRLRVLRAEGTELELIGETKNLGKPREVIHSTRFVGDLAYVVTFERIDPLVVVSLKDPEAPKVLGKVEIPGFSTYMHPLDEGHLLTIGEFVDPQNGGNRALQLQIFDVTDPTAPRKAESYLFPTGGNSIAAQEHKAFTFFPEQDLLAFPYVDWQHTRSTLEVFRVSTEDGFERLGAVDHLGLFENCYDYPDDVGSFDVPPIDMVTFPPDADPAMVEQYRRRNAFYACPGQGVRRGVFIDDFIYSLSYGGVLVHKVGDLTVDSSERDAVARIDLQRPLYPDWTGNDGFWGFPIPAPPAFAGGSTPTNSSGMPATAPVDVDVASDVGEMSAAPAEPVDGGVDGGVNGGVVDAGLSMPPMPPMPMAGTMEPLPMDADAGMNIEP